MTHSRAHTPTTIWRERHAWEEPYDAPYLDNPFSPTPLPTPARDRDTSDRDLDIGR
jgi:hypothetical protein